MKEVKHVGSFNLTEAGYHALATLQKKTGKSKKEIVSSALEASLIPVLDRKVVEFQLPDPKTVMTFRTDVVVIEAVIKDLVDALYGLRPRDKEYAKKLAGLIGQLQDELQGLRFIDDSFRQKLLILKGLTPEDYERIPRVVKWVEGQRLAAKGKPDEKNRLIFINLIEKLARLSAPAALPSSKSAVV
jgi:hypothetical protein